eukprot:1733005-Prymnesium_polylepis.1
MARAQSPCTPQVGARAQRVRRPTVGCAVALVLAQALVGAHDVLQLVRQVVLGAPIGPLHLHRRAHLRARAAIASPSRCGGAGSAARRQRGGRIASRPNGLPARRATQRAALPRGARAARGLRAPGAAARAAR